MEDLELSERFWRGRRVLVTGHTGFKGGWLSLWLRALGARVSGLALAPPTRPSLFEAARVAEGIESRTGDIREAGAVASALQAAAPQIVFHLAAQPLVIDGYAQPVETYATNLLGTVHVLEATARAGGVKAFVGVTSDKCYLNRERAQGYTEDEPLGGSDPYSSSKACAEIAIAAYRDSFLRARGVAAASARAGNVIGGGDWAANRLVPDLVRAFVGRAPAELRRPDAVRPWQHVLDPLAGYLKLGAKLLEGGDRWAQAWNFGPDAADDASVGELAARVARAWGPEARTVNGSSGEHHEAHTLRLDAAKARTQLGWRPRWNLDAAVDATVRWYRAWHAGEDMRAFSLAQIASYSR